MATEAQRLIGISLTKIAQSRGHRGGISLHKNLLVATVLQKARYIFMEEAYHMVHSGNYRPIGTTESPSVISSHHQQSSTSVQNNNSSSSYMSNLYQSTTTTTETETQEDNNLIAVTPEEVGLCVNSSNCVKCNQNQTELSYIDKSSTRDRNRLKRRCTISDWETEEAILSILPKRSKHVSSQAHSDTDNITITELKDDSTETTTIDDLTQLSACISSELCSTDISTNNEHELIHSDTTNNSTNSNSVMEIDRITSLVSIFSFTNFCSSDSTDKLTRSVSTPDLCSAQAKETLQQRPVIAMTV